MYIVIEVIEGDVINATEPYATFEEAKEEMLKLFDKHESDDSALEAVSEHSAFKRYCRSKHTPDYHYDVEWEIVEISNWEAFTRSLPKSREEDNPVWFDGNEILTISEEWEDRIFNVLKLMGLPVVSGYYDPEDDKRNKETDSYTGLYYITIE